MFGAFARQDQTPFAYPAPPITVGSITQMTVMRKRIADGTALPDEIAAFEATSAERAKAMQDAIGITADALIAARADKLFLMGLWSGHYAVAKAVRDRGYSGKDFHPENAIFTSGGLKRVQVPDDYREFVYETFNIKSERVYLGYGMQELQTIMPKCSHGRYHVPAWLVVLPLNQEGDELLPVESGEGHGPRSVFRSFDGWALGGAGSSPATRSRSISIPCSCGAKSPSVSDNVTRYADLTGDDKIGCAGTVDAYVRGLS